MSIKKRLVLHFELNFQFARNFNTNKNEIKNECPCRHRETKNE